MRSEQISFRALPELKKIMRGIQRRGGFKNLSRLYFGLSIIAWQNDRRGQGFHGGPSWVKDLANANPKDQDFVVRHMMQWPDDFKKMLLYMKRINDKR